MPGITCNDGPQVYREWLGIKYVNPWIKVKKCISYGCKSSEVKKITKKILLRDTSYFMYTVNQHVKCINS